MEFKEWLNQKYKEWSGNGKKSESQFAIWLGINQATISAWKLGTRGKPKQKSLIDKLAEKYPEVYDILGLEKSRPRYDVSRLPPSTRRDLEGALDEIDAELSRRNITGDMPEAETITFQIFEKWGFKYMVTNKPD